MRRVRVLVALAAAGAMFPAKPQIRFEEVARKAGLPFQLRNAAAGGFHSIELMVGGVAVLDFNNDGCADIFFTNGAAIPSLRKTGPEFFNRLYRNNCDMTFTDVTEHAGVAGEGYSMAVAAADFDNDGFTDIFVAGVNRNILYRNLGNGRFEDVTAKAGLTGADPRLGKPWSVSAGWFDYDNDGWLDLFVSNYVAWDPAIDARYTPKENRFYCHPDSYAGLPNQLFHNNRDRCVAGIRHRKAHRQGDGSRLRRLRPGRVHRRVCGERLRPQFPVSQPARWDVSRDSGSRRGAPRGRRCHRRHGGRLNGDLAKVAATTGNGMRVDRLADLQDRIG